VRSVLSSVLLAAALAAPAAPAAAQVSFTTGPQRGQLYPRDAHDTAVVAIAGEVTEPGWTAARLVVTREGAPWAESVVTLQYANGVAPLSFAPTIAAGLFEYAFELRLEGGGQSLLAHRTEHVVCGDAFLIQGQSNAVAGDGLGEGLANLVSQSRWTRSFGTSDMWTTADDLKWHLADGEAGGAPGAVGGWGIRLAQHVVERVGVPVAVLNGAVGATPIQWHHRNDADPEDLGTNYGRLLWRARQAGLDQHVKAILWHQGEANGSTPPAEYLFWFKQMRNDWLEDFPAVERIYVFQIRDGCGVDGMGVREVQRQLPDRVPGVSVMSTSAVGGHDGCHYRYTGYREFGDRIARLVLRDLYGFPVPAAADAPNPAEAVWTSAARDAIRIRLRDPHEVLRVDAGIEAWFEVDAPESVTAVTAAPGELLVQLSGPSSATRVSWIGHEKGGPWIRNRLGVGALTFSLEVR
jgi:hypothetical protein